MAHDEISFSELKNKEIVNEMDGRRLGRTCDLIFSPRDGCVLGIVAPFSKRGLFFKGQEVFIPFKHIAKIGPDVILVRLTPELSQTDGCVNMGKNEGYRKFEGKRPSPKSGRETRSGGYAYERGGAYDDERDYGGGHGYDERGYKHGDGEYYGEENDRVKMRTDSFGRADVKEGPSADGGMPDGCDFRCEKCMLFDCNKRWKGGQRQQKRPQRAFPGEDDGRAYVDGKLYETNEK